MSAVPEEMVKRRRRLWWLAAANKIGAVVATAWTVVLAFEAAGLWRALLTTVLLSLLLKLGPAALFAVSASVLCFHYEVVGIWLPVASYLTAGIALIFDWNLSRATQGADIGVTPDSKTEPGPSIEQMNSEEWNRQLSGIVEQFGATSPDVDVRVFPHGNVDPNSTPLFHARPDDLIGTISRIRGAFGTGQFQVIVWVKGEVRRRFVLLVE